MGFAMLGSGLLGDDSGDGNGFRARAVDLTANSSRVLVPRQESLLRFCIEAKEGGRRGAMRSRQPGRRHAAARAVLAAAGRHCIVKCQ